MKQNLWMAMFVIEIEDSDWKSKGLLKLIRVSQIFNVPDIDFISSLDINTFDLFPLNPIILR